jgi:hypothetical protein
MSGQRVSTGIYLGDKLVKPVFGNQFVGINPFFAADIVPVIDSSTKLFLDTTNPSSYPGTGNTWSDLSGNGNNANVTDITSYWTGSGGGYFDWPGNDYTKVATVTHSSSLNLFNSDFTVMFVGTVDTAAGGTSDLVGPFAKPDWNLNPSMGWLMIRNSADGNYRKGNFYLNGTGIGLSTGTFFDSLGAFFVAHIVRSGSTVTYYTTANTSIGSFTSSANGNNSNNLRIGRGRDNATFNYRWDGKQAGIGFYNKALTSDERLQNINYFKAKLGF